jgi:acetyltransferase-like isoleucine patch superfamily enzyme
MCKESETNFFFLVLRYAYYRVFYQKYILMHQKASLVGVKNIEMNGTLKVGTSFVGFSHKTDKTLLRVDGKLILKGDYLIARGCRFDISKGGTVTIGKGGYINCNSKVIVSHKLTIGDECIIAWDCQFLDNDFHEIMYLGKKDADLSITIGNKVWIGCGTKIYKGTAIPNGCVVAADSVIKGVFTNENALIGGNPARVLKENIQWD